MKTLIILISLLFIFDLFGQVTDSLGIDNNINLNKQEIYFLNNSLKNSRDTFGFNNKRIAFVTGSNGSKLITKQNYFLTCVKPWTDKGSEPQISFVRLTPNEKQISNGYDAIVMSWVKVLTKKQRKRIIKQLTWWNK